MIRRVRWLLPWRLGHFLIAGILDATISIYPVQPGEESSAVVTVDFFDERGNAWTPKTVTWTLTDDLSHVINNRSAVEVTPAPQLKIVLSGNDLAIQTGGIYRAFLIEATYDSTLGTNLPLRRQMKFVIKNWLGVS